MAAPVSKAQAFCKKLPKSFIDQYNLIVYAATQCNLNRHEFYNLIYHNHVLHPQASKVYKSTKKNKALYDARPRKKTKLDSLYLYNILKCKRKNAKVPRIVKCNHEENKKVVQQLLEKQFYFHASKLLYFMDAHKDCITVSFDESVNVLQIYGSIKHCERHCGQQEYIITKAEKCTFLTITNIETCRFFLISDWVTDSCAIRKHTLLVTPYIVHRFIYGKKKDIFVFLRIILRWLTVSRQTGRGMLSNDHYGFQIYSYFPFFCTLFDHYDNDFFEGLKSFLQLQSTHYISSELVCNLYDFFTSDESAKNIFKPVWQSVYKLTQTVVQLPKKNTKIYLQDYYKPQGETSCLHVCFFLYAMILHPKVPVDLKHNIWKQVYTKQKIVKPCCVKGADHILQARDIHNTYDKYIKGSHGDAKLSVPKEFTNLITQLETQSFFNSREKKKGKKKKIKLSTVTLNTNYESYTEDMKFPIVYDHNNNVTTHDKIWTVRWNEFDTKEGKYSEFVNEEIICAYLQSI